MDKKEQYGKSPVFELLKEIRELNATPAEDKAYAYARMVEERVDNEV